MNKPRQGRHNRWGERPREPAHSLDMALLTELGNYFGSGSTNMPPLTGLGDVPPRRDGAKGEGGLVAPTCHAEVVRRRK